MKFVFDHYQNPFIPSVPIFACIFEYSSHLRMWSIRNTSCSLQNWLPCALLRSIFVVIWYVSGTAGCWWNALYFQCITIARILTHTQTHIPRTAWTTHTKKLNVKCSYLQHNYSALEKNQFESMQCICVCVCAGNVKKAGDWHGALDHCKASTFRF